MAYYFHSRAQRTLPCTPWHTIFTKGPEGPFRAPRGGLFLLKGPKNPSVHPVTRRNRPIGRLSSSNKKHCQCIFHVFFLLLVPFLIMVQGPRPGPKLVPVLGPGSVIFLVSALVPVPSYFWSRPWSRSPSTLLIYHITHVGVP